jgi:biotin carboxyl carrier protein
MRSDSANAMRLLAAVLSQKSFAASAHAMATELALVFNSERACVGWLEQGCAKVVALSGGAHFDPRQEAVATIAAAMDESMEQEAVIAVPSGDTSASYITRANAELLAINGGGVCAVPLVDVRRVVGAVTLERSSSPFDASELRWCEDLACLVGPILAVKAEAERSALHRALNRLRRYRAELLEPGNPTKKLTAGAALLVLLSVTLIPVPYRISAPGRLEGSMQRVVVAPVDGFLQQVNVRPGDFVREKQVLAELAGDDLAMEFRKRQSELLQHENAFQAALARADRTLLVINQAKAAEAEAQLALVEHQMDRAQIRAPFDGVVIKGDLSQSLGAPVQRGEVLLTLAPGAHFRLIVEVDERDIAHVQPGQVGTLALAAMPHETLGFVVQRVMPVATAGEGRNFFEVEARIPAPHAPLRPGLKGVAKLDAGTHSVAWMLTHRLFDWLRLTFWSLGL